MTSDLPAPQGNPYEDTDENKAAVQALVKKRFDEFSRGRENFLWPAFRNIFFYRGRQWIRFVRTAVTGWQPIRPRDPNTPLPVTNKFARVMNSLFSMFARFEPSLQFAPASPDPEDRAAADVSSRAMDVIGDEVNITTSRQHGAKWVTLTGGVWRETGYDNDPAHGMVDTPMMLCADEACGHQEPLGPDAPAASPDLAALAAPPDAMLAPEGQSLDAGGMAPPTPAGPPCPECQSPMAPGTVPMPKGRMFVAERSGFEMFFDPSIMDWTKQRDYVCQNAVDESVAKGRWKKLGDAIKADSTAGNMFMETLPTLGPQYDDNGRGPMSTGTRISNTKVTENWYWALPTEKYPQGLLAILLGKQPAEVAWFGPLPYYYAEEDGGKAYFLPHVFFPQDEVPGSAWPKTVADDLAEKQRMRNRVELQMDLCIMKMSNPIWMSPRGAAPSALTGNVGQVVEYNPIGVGGVSAKPERLDGRPIPASLGMQIDRIDHEMDEIAITSAVMRGEHTPGVTAAMAINILKERGESQFGPMFIKWNHAEAQWARQALAIFRMFATEPRLQKIKGRDGAWEVSKFMAADLRGRVDVIPEAGLTLPRSTMSERAEIQELIGMGLLNVMDPDVRMEILKRWHALSLLPAMEKDVKRAEMENEQFRALATSPAVQQAPPTVVQQVRQTIALEKAKGTPPPAILEIVEHIFASVGLAIPRVKQAIDDHAVHAREHRQDAKSESFDQRPELVQVFEELHISVHDFYQGQAMQAMAALQAGGQPTGHPGPAPGSPPNPVNAARSSSSPQRMAGEQREQTRMGVSA